ncbi:MAG: hypothetical protein GC181_14430 [Bacteroidetes bacterium]|nr:hypothetical protein [Bacteroidota bacterium]
MLRNLLTAFIFLCSIIGIRAQVVLEKYVEFGVPVLIGTADQNNLGFPDRLGRVATIDVNKLEAERKKFSALRYKSSFGLSAGHIISTSKSTFLKIAFGYSQYSLESSGKYLRLSDARGSNNPSIYSVQKFNYVFRVVNMDISGKSTYAGKKNHHSFSCGIRSSILTQSKYLVELKHSTTGQEKYTYQKDLRFTDGVFNCSPFFQYDFTPQISKGRTKYSLLVSNINLMYRNNFGGEIKKFTSVNRLFVAQISVSKVLRRTVVDNKHESGDEWKSSLKFYYS